ncbi:hypothetical protein KKA47_03790 [bacterium]|nr:hypothetical protein [bacterium]
MKKMAVLSIGLALFVLSSFSLFAYQEVIGTLEQAVVRADQIAQVKCISQETKFKKINGKKYYVMEATFEVQNPIKGMLPKGEYKLQQSRLATMMPNMKFFPMISYIPNQEYVLLLSETNARGDRVPVGGKQSVFEIKEGTVTNVYNNVKLFKDIEKAPKIKSASKAVKASIAKVASHKSGPVDQGDFINIMGALVN